MRRWAISLILLELGCASGGQPAGADDVPTPVTGGDDAGFGGGPGSGTFGADDASTGANDASTGPSGNDPGFTGAAANDVAANDDTMPGADSTAVPPFDPGEGGTCLGALAPGDLVIDELMIESVAGAGDHGEWLEVKSTLGCALDLRGLHGDAPSGNKIRTFDIGGDLWIPAFGWIVVADSNSAAIDHDLPGTVVAWAGQPGDVLRNKGGTVTLHFGGAVIDSITYPSMALTVGASLAFPSDCASSRRSDWTAWQWSTSSWFPGFLGTPGAPNDDVNCLP
jgi:hypothetical protein